MAELAHYNSEHSDEKVNSESKPAKVGGIHGAAGQNESDATTTLASRPSLAAKTGNQERGQLTVFILIPFCM